MGMTIRNNVFETNSSSTHSISIVNINEKIYLPIVDNEYIYPLRLNQYEHYIESGDGGHILRCDTIELKTAIVLQWINALKEYDDISNELYFKLEYLVLNNICRKVNWEGQNYFDYYPSDEGYFGNNYGFDKCSFDEDYIEVINKLILIINDNNKCIVDEETPY